MAQPTTSFFDELIGAARGCFALLIGNRQAPAYFDFSQRGLVGSFIALVLSFAVQTIGPPLVGIPTDTGLSLSALVLASVVTAAGFGVAFLVLRQLGRSDGFVPFMVVQNWATLFQAILALAIIGIFGHPVAIDPTAEMAELTSGSIPFVILAVVVLIASINLARLILTLRPLHVALFILAQLGTSLVLQAVLGAVL